MTALSTDAWQGMPGWAIAADLMPPELVVARRVRKASRALCFAMALLVVLCAGGYVYGMQQSSNASDEVASANQDTTRLQNEAARYADVTKIEGAVAGLQSQVAQLMSTDVDVAVLSARIALALPKGMALQSITVTLNQPGATTAAAPTLDTSGHAVIGTVTITGTGRTLDDLPAFVDRLSALKGVTSVLPGTNSVQQGITTFGVAFGITDQLYTHRYAASISGSK